MVFAALILGSACGPVAENAPSPEEAQAREVLAEPLGSADLAQQLANNSPRDLAATPTPQSVQSSSPGEESVEVVTIEFDDNGVEVGFTEDGHPYRGDPDAPIVIMEFSDFQCPFCSRFYDQTLPSLAKNQIANGEVLLVYYDYPLTSIHPQAMEAANAARCAAEQGAVAYWGMHDLIFANPDHWSNANAIAVFHSYATELGLDADDFRSCQESKRHYEGVLADIDFGRSRGVNSTPSFFINGQPLIGAQPLTIFNQAIAAVQDGQTIAASDPPASSANQPAPRPTPVSISSNDAAGILGDTEAAVTIVEYTDYQCPFCQRHNNETMPTLISNLVDSGRVRYILKDFPLDQIHPQARLAAVAARCAGEQDSYWVMHDAIFAAQIEWSGQAENAATILSGLADDLGLDIEAYRECAGSGRYDVAIQTNLEEGVSLGVGGTPFFFVNGFPVNGAQPYGLFEYAVELAEQGNLADAYVQEPEPEPAPPTQPRGPVDVPVAGAYSIGDPDAPVTIVEYTDYQCPFCARHMTETLPEIKSKYIDSGIVRYVFKDFPLTSIHPQAVAAAEAARCAGEQGAYVEMHDALFGNQGQWSNSADPAGLYGGYAESIGLDRVSFDDCLSSHRFLDAVMADLDEGIGFGVGGTPAFFLNGYFLSGAQPFTVFEEAINSLLSD
jgi:protein-disulfide isomerase